MRKRADTEFSAFEKNILKLNGERLGGKGNLEKYSYKILLFLYVKQQMRQIPYS